MKLARLDRSATGDGRPCAPTTVTRSYQWIRLAKQATGFELVQFSSNIAIPKHTDWQINSSGLRSGCKAFQELRIRLSVS